MSTSFSKLFCHIWSVLTIICRADDSGKRGRGGPRTRGAARGATRGAAATAKVPPARKPRVTKAAKVQLEQEKAQRANMANLAAKPTGYPG